VSKLFECSCAMHAVGRYRSEQLARIEKEGQGQGTLPPSHPLCIRIAGFNSAAQHSTIQQWVLQCSCFPFPGTHPLDEDKGCSGDDGENETNGMEQRKQDKENQKTKTGLLL
jgi:hypothetical protein